MRNSVIWGTRLPYYMVVIVYYGNINCFTSLLLKVTYWRGINGIMIGYDWDFGSLHCGQTIPLCHSILQIITSVKQQSGSVPLTTVTDAVDDTTPNWFSAMTVYSPSSSGTTCGKLRVYLFPTCSVSKYSLSTSSPSTSHVTWCKHVNTILYWGIDKKCKTEV